MAKVNVQGYLDTIHAPWGQIFYKLAWHNIECEGKKIHDFGSGFGITASHLAEANDVTAIEPNEEMLAHRVLKPDGFISIIKHNKAGKIMQKAVFEYNIDEALRLLDDENVESANFGTINEYEDSELEKYAKGKLRIEKIYGLRMFYALQRNERKTGEEWLDTMYKLECRAQEVPVFRDIAFFHHIILKNTTADT